MSFKYCYQKIKRIFSKIRYKLLAIWFQLANKIIFINNNVSYNSYLIKGYIRVYREYVINKDIPKVSIYIGERFVCNSGLKYNPIGGDVCTILRTIDDGMIKIGKNVGMSNATLVAWKKIEIEDDVMIGGGVKIYDTDFHSLDYYMRVCKPQENIVSRPVKICKGAFIGAGSYILKGVTIGEKSIVGAGSVVAKSIPAGEIWAGNPAKFIRKI